MDKIPKMTEPPNESPQKMDFSKSAWLKLTDNGEMPGNSKIIAIIAITSAILLSIPCIIFFYALFFFFGFFNPSIFVGTSPLLFLALCVRQGKKKYVALGWFLISLLPVIIISIIMFATGNAFIT